jgi:hypothetical protein
MFLAGIASVGIAHQTGWLVTSPEPLFDNQSDTAKRIRSANNLKHMVVALHNYADHQGQLPPSASTDPDGRPLLSWRVLLLPYLEEEDLFQEFRLDQPWDSPHNLRLLPRIPSLFRHPGRVKDEVPYMTHYQVFVGPGTAFERGAVLRFPEDFPDGINNTILIAEAAEPVPWTKPVDLPFLPNKPLPKLGGLSKKRFHVAMADGSTRLRATVANRQGIGKPRVRANLLENSYSTL